MNKNKLETISNLFENKEIRSIWNSEKEDYYFSVVDVIYALTDSINPRNYWNMLKSRLTDEGSELYTNCVQLKMKAKDGKLRLTDTLDTEGIFRLIESVPSPKAEPFKLWLAKLGREKIDEVFDPSKGIDQMIDFYLKKGYSLEWIEARIKAIIDRKKLTKVWYDNGVKSNKEYAILTNAIYKEWSGMTASEYKAFKGIRKENLRDNMSDIEVALTNLGEITTRDIAKEEQPKGLKENIGVAKRGGSVAKGARDLYEKETRKLAITSEKNLNYQYIDENEQIENK
ncbi:MAG: phage antirepressor protein [Bacilli bacterium]|nr:phage antirepressor protein [Bacilli bacterium]